MSQQQKQYLHAIKAIYCLNDTQQQKIAFMSNFIWPFRHKCFSSSLENTWPGHKWDRFMLVFHCCYNNSAQSSYERERKCGRSVNEDNFLYWYLWYFAVSSLFLRFVHFFVIIGSVYAMPLNTHVVRFSS